MPRKFREVPCKFRELLRKDWELPCMFRELPPRKFKELPLMFKELPLKLLVQGLDSQGPVSGGSSASFTHDFTTFDLGGSRP